MPALEAPVDVVAQPALEPVAAPALAVPDLAPAAPEAAPATVTLQEVAPGPPGEVPVDVAVVTPAVEALPEPETAVPAPPPPPLPEPEAALDAPETAADAPVSAPPAVSTPDAVVMPDDRGTEQPTEPPQPAVPADDPAPGAEEPPGLMSPLVELYQEGPVPALPGSSIAPPPRPARTQPAEQPTTVVTPRVIVEGRSTPPADERPARAGLRRTATSEPSEAPSPEPVVTEDEAPAPSAAATRPLTSADADALAHARVEFNGQALPDEARPEVRDGVLMVSLKHIFEAADGALYWFADGSTARAVTVNADLTVQVGTARATVNGESWELEAPVEARDGRVMVPTDLVARALGVAFNFDAREGLVLIGETERAEGTP